MRPLFRRRHRYGTLIGVLVLAAGLSSADDDAGSDMRKPPPQAIAPEPPAAPLALSHLLQHEVVNAAGTWLARLDDLVLDNGGRVRYAILSHTGLLNLQEHILVPWQALALSVNHPIAVTLDMTADELERAPRVDRPPQREQTALDRVDWRNVDRFYLAMFAARGDSLASIKDQFALLDRDGSCYLSPAEAALLPPLDQDFPRADSNHDQRLDKGEFARFESAREAGSQRTP